MRGSFSEGRSFLEKALAKSKGVGTAVRAKALDGAGLLALNQDDFDLAETQLALGVQLLIGYCGQVTLGHSAFIAVGAYTSTLLMLQLHLPYLLTLLMGGLTGGLWCVFFGLPSARVKGFYLIMTTMAAQFITVEFFITWGFTVRF